VRGSASEGIHAASTGGVWQAVVFGFAGVRLTPSGPIGNPLPPDWTRVKFRLHWRKQWYEFDIQDTGKVITTENRTEQLGIERIQPLAQPQFHPPPPPTPVLERHRETPQNGGRVPHPGCYLRPGWRAHHTSNFTTGAGSSWLMKKAFLSTGNERLRGLSRRDSLMQLLGEQQVKEEAQEMMARKNGYYEVNSGSYAGGLATRGAHTIG